MHRIIFGLVAALAVGFVGGVTFGMARPSGGASPMTSNSLPVPTTAHAPVSSSAIPERSEPADVEASAAEPDAPVVAREAVATQNAARATMPLEGSKAQPGTPASPRTSNPRPPVILGIRH